VQGIKLKEGESLPEEVKQLQAKVDAALEVIHERKQRYDMMKEDDRLSKY